MAWRAARSLLVLQQQLKAGAPRAAPPATGADEWGLIGDAAHDPTSDHTPHDFPGWGNDIVTAADFPNRPDLGLDAHKVLDDIRRSHDARVKYGISNGQMFSSYAVKGFDPWTWRPYNPKNGDKHFTHGHLSVVGDSRADGTQPWATIGASATAGGEDDDDMGASIGPIQIQPDTTSLSIPPVEAGAADPRQAWINVCNDTYGTRYALRVWFSKGDKTFQPLGGKEGLFALDSGERLSVQLPAGTACLSISRKAVDSTGSIVDPNDEFKPYLGHLTCCIERGPVLR
ncbi:hypothetical protein [Dactylosporangium sp. CA-092794]|uniref:hypothetical protein n=1 Tax=Dactylosporangium sp. CA-092794 TaxID=3239929 RepID=UPI003D8FBC47